MAFNSTRNGRRVSKRQLQTWLGQYERGDRTKVDIERQELGDFTSRGKYISRLWDSELDVATVNVLR